ncbi:YifB family Mg chelatase-like AAA ATPase [Robiginitalea sp. M366]|uniref:YifB family Mg chelatase-like AAA ATPase n=1 Tax=Robiginitalea aestuariiviva TaxID=3036903 RepID=UPI00240DAF53|nr:YifB family Mg chelatase-like AAA ATPase [Robiginitalea aestuariiviva]MDG1572827.1 YifB family Mg chelatase-like AAA ATPase [Robiginitalea aestuariiviva]
MLAKVYGSAVLGIEAITVTIEVNIDTGIGYHLVGLPDNAIRESNYRIAAALLHNGYRIPGKKVTINMAPADLRKEGAAYDLSLALGILLASGQLASEAADRYMVMGELALDGTLHPIKGALSIALKARNEGFRGVVFPAANAPEAAVVKGLEVYGAGSLEQVITFFKTGEGLEPVKATPFETQPDPVEGLPDFNEVRGQETVKRCMEIAAAGGHNMILIGPPGSGKTMLAKRLPGILPPMSLEEALETTKIHSVTGVQGRCGLVRQRPFRCPHHTISDVALVGGGSYPQPGEISLAHNGVLFLDELPEFKRHVLEVMRQPLEEREVTISRARVTVTYPSSFMLVASMNPSPGGYFNDQAGGHGNNPAEVRRYLGRVSGPLLDRIDIHMEVSPVPYEQLSDARKGEPSASIRARVTRAREVQKTRLQGAGIHCNAQMNVRQIRQYCALSPAASRLLGSAMERLQLSARAYDRILKVARTIADLEGSAAVTESHLSEAIQYRSLDREGWLA